MFGLFQCFRENLFDQNWIVVFNFHVSLERCHCVWKRIFRSSLFPHADVLMYMEQKHLAQLLMKTSHKGSDNVFNIYSVSTTINKIILTSDPFVVLVI